MPDLSEILSACRGAGYVVAPAGFGKTYLIAKSASLSPGRQLILTHTHAGVAALRRKMREFGVSDRIFHIETIAGWSLRLSLSYSTTSDWEIENPTSNEEWNGLYDACARLLDSAFIRRIIEATYVGLYVDEYQDCSTAQHGIVLKLARYIPSRILGDPLQGIFDFDGQNSVDWSRDIEANFQNLGTLDVPHRWIRAGTANLGAWLLAVRTSLEQGLAIDLTQGRPPEVRLRLVGANPGEVFQAQSNACRYLDCDSLHTVIGVHKGSQEYKAKCHKLSRNLSGMFSSIEEVEGKELFSFVAKMERARTNSQRLRQVIAFADKCMTSVNSSISAGLARGEYVNIRGTTRNPEIARHGNDYLDNPSSAAMLNLLAAFKATPGVNTVRSDLFNRAIGVLRKHMLHPDLSLLEAAKKYQSAFRFIGRPVGRRKLIGTTLLVKGLEFDHAIVLDATSLSRKELYVALTRGARSLTIVSSSAVLAPVD